MLSVLCSGRAGALTGGGTGNTRSVSPAEEVPVQLLPSNPGWAERHHDSLREPCVISQMKCNLFGNPLEPSDAKKERNKPTKVWGKK